MTYYEGIENVKELEEVNHVNDHLANGWVLLTIKEESKTSVDPVTSLPVHEMSIVYILGYRGKVQAQVQSQVQQPVVTQQEFVVTVDHLGQLPWKEGKYGEWVFSDAGKYTEPALTPNQKKIHAWLLQKLKEGWSESETYKYKLSGEFIGKQKR